MKIRLLALAAAFALVGAGCTLPSQTPSNELGDLPTTPPTQSGSDVSDDSDYPSPGEPVMMDKDGDAREADAMPEPDDEVLVGSGGGAMMEDDSDRMEKDTSAKKPYYIAYTKDVAEAALAEGRPVVYYFWAAWCPICRAEEPSIKSWIETSEHPVAGFRVNYDTESSLKAQYKIPYQHTTVFLNAAGEEVERFSGPVSESEFREALAKASE